MSLDLSELGYGTLDRGGDSRKPVFRVPTMPESNQSAQLQRLARIISSERQNITV